MPPDDARTTHVAPSVDHCAYCGLRSTPETPASERFGDRFCSDAHAEQFAEGVRAARMELAARRVDPGDRPPPGPTACSLPPAGQRMWKDSLKRGACWGAPVLLLLAIPLFWSGTLLGAAGGSLFGVLAALACPVGMYFVMRAMGNMGQHNTARREGARRGSAKEDSHA